MQKLPIIFLLLLLTFKSVAGENELNDDFKPLVADKIIAVTGETVILKSEYEVQLRELQRFRQMPASELRCVFLNELLQQKIILSKAISDSVVITDSQVEEEMDRRLRHFIAQVGSERVLENYFNKSIEQIREELRKDIREQLLIQRLQSEIISDITVSPSEVKKFFNKIPADSLPFFNTEVEIAQIVRHPVVTEEERQAARERITDIRRRIVDEDESFETLAILYSDDPGSSLRGGDIGMTQRTNLESPYAAAAMNLDKNEISPVIETKYGFHIIQLIDRIGERIHTRHILIKPRETEEARLKALHFLDSLRIAIIEGEISFQDAAIKSSQDEKTRNSGGLKIEPQTGDTRFPVDKLESSVFYAIDTLEPGEISRPVSFEEVGGGTAYRIIKLINKVAPHQANLKDDYAKIQHMAKENKRQEVLNEWVDQQIRKTYIRIDSEFHDCPEIRRWINQ